MPLRPRPARAAACTTAGLLAVTTGLALAVPADAAAPRLPYRTHTSTGVVVLHLTLPAAVPGLPKVIDLTLLGTDAQGFHGATGADVATAHSYLAGGSLLDATGLAAALAPLDSTVTADLAHPGTHGGPAVAVPTNPLGLALGAVTQVATSTVATRAATSSSTLAGTSLGSLGSLGLGAVLNPALSAVTGALTTVNTSATPLTDVVSGLPVTLPVVTVPNPLSGTVGGPATITTPSGLSAATLVATINELPARITALQDKLVNGAVLRLSALSTHEAVLPKATSVTASGLSGVADGIDLFGGLVHITVGAAKVSATSAGTPSAASASASATTVSVKVSDAFGTLLNLVAGDKGLTAGILDGTIGTSLSATEMTAVGTVDAALGTVLAQLQGVLAGLGGSVPVQGVATHSVSADGRTAKAHAAPASVGFSLPGAPDLVALSVGSADAVSSQSVAAPTVVPAAPAVATPRDLPHTGGSTGAALLALGVLAIGGGTVVLRRRTAQQ